MTEVKGPGKGVSGTSFDPWSLTPAVCCVDLVQAVTSTQRTELISHFSDQRPLKLGTSLMEESSTVLVLWDEPMGSLMKVMASLLKEKKKAQSNFPFNSRRIQRSFEAQDEEPG